MTKQQRLQRLHFRQKRMRYHGWNVTEQHKIPAIENYGSDENIYDDDYSQQIIINDKEEDKVCVVYPSSYDDDEVENVNEEESNSDDSKAYGDHMKTR